MFCIDLSATAIACCRGCPSTTAFSGPAQGIGLGYLFSRLPGQLGVTCLVSSRMLNLFIEQGCSIKAQGVVGLYSAIPLPAMADLFGFFLQVCQKSSMVGYFNFGTMLFVCQESEPNPEMQRDQSLPLHSGSSCDCLMNRTTPWLYTLYLFRCHNTGTTEKVMGQF